MGYRLYLAKAKCQENTLEKIKQGIMDATDEDGYFQNYIFVEKLAFHTIMELDNDDAADTIRKSKRSYFPDEIIEEDKSNNLGQIEDIDSGKIAEVTKEDILELIKLYHLNMITYYENKYKEKVNDDTAQAASKLCTWNTSYKYLKVNMEGKLLMPYVVEDSWEYRILKLVDIYNKTDWKNEVVILYGW